MMIRLDDRVAIVTGAGSGLGRSHALALASRGAKVVVNDFAPARDGAAERPADLVVAEIRAAGGTAVANGSSVSDPEQAASMVAQAVSEFGRIDILVNNAGFLRDRSFAKLTAADFDAVVAVHLGGAAYCTMAAWAHMREHNHGRIVFTTSNSGLFGNFGQSNYAAAKAGLIGLMNALKQEGAKYGIAVNTLSPMAATPMTETVMDEATRNAFDPALVSAAVVHLCSDEFTESGNIVSTAGGYISAVRIVSSRGALLGRSATPEAIAECWARINDFSSARGFNSAGDEMRHILERLSVKTAA
ncbi:SDR family NAD(P)-dependent oxidoreductase [Mesorhizobium sp. ASY16-5R]|uniref:SDR family NAD(P)-dependent oxidoreductase n=1 Tax=Mesorhizobium sp. ASY16-5R TaxID=3445772 RepID=UPI003FA0C257